MDTDIDTTTAAREVARQRALQRAPGNTPGTVASSIADAASDAWEPGVRAAYQLLRDEFGIEGELDPHLAAAAEAARGALTYRERARRAIAARREGSTP